MILQNRLWARPLSVLAGVALACATVPAASQSSVDYGKQLYRDNCAVCHGPEGKGDGPYRPYLTKDPADLTVLSRMNNGVFPVSRVYQVIDGRWEVGAHGPREMPIWGYAYVFRPPDNGLATPYEMEAVVRARILALVEYVSRLQAR